MGNRQDSNSIIADRVEDGIREPGKDALADDVERRTGRFGMLGDVAEATFDLVEESAAEPGTPEVVEVRRFVQLKFGRFVDIESRAHARRDRARARTS